MFDPVVGYDILVRPGKWERQIDVDTSRTWNDLTPGEQLQIRTGKAVVYDFFTFDRPKKGCTRDATGQLWCNDPWYRRKPAAQPRSGTDF